jgi:hypothetical protein
MSLRRTIVGLLAIMLGAAVVSVLPSQLPASATAADPAQSDSAVTVSGKPDGPFANLKVTVSQTKNLINQVVRVSWTGGAPTVSSTEFLVNYLQIMQCWGDDPNGPDRTQCQYGGSDNQVSPTAGTWVRTRQVSNAYLVDNKESLTGQSGYVYVPFWPVDRPKPTGPGTADINDFFDSQVTNEDPLARTHGDGTGEEFFEIETVTQAAGLGCGEPITTDGVTKGRSCWLVIVPRGTTEVDGSTRYGTNSSTDYLISSPLSQSNWDNRIVVPLEFQPVGDACPIGAPERRVVGHEMMSEAITSWQPALCADGGALYSFSQLPDEVARSQVQDGGLAVVNNPIPPDQVPADHPLFYAPVGLSGLTIAFNIEHQPPGSASDDDLKENGKRFTSLKLTPLLVAKLLTQSYQSAMVKVPDALKDNPFGLLYDPDFLTLNPEYTGFTNVNAPVPDALVQLNGSDATSLLWNWINADPNAHAFLTGTPKGKMRINPLNENPQLPLSTFPRNDQTCVPVLLAGSANGQACNLDAHPFTTDMHDAGRAASRGDSKAQEPVAVNGILTVKKADRQTPGARALLAVVDAATASRYGLPTAELCNAAGTNCVGPTSDHLLAGEAAMKPSAVPGVLAADPSASDPAAYPLTTLSYAVTSPTMLDAAAGKDYAAFLRYAGGPGQQPGIEPGQLPPGMVPLPDSLKKQTIAAAAAIEAQISQTATSETPTSQTPTSSTPTSPSAPPPITTAPTQNLTGGTHPPAGINSTAPSSAPARPLPTHAPSDDSATPPVVAQQPIAKRGKTPWPSMPAVGSLFLVILIGGTTAAMSSPALQRLGGGLRRRWREEVTPTDQ